ncbi:MAG TPA: redoxin domain-containing protein [Candidatus Limnocylindria bacterium]|nr:redoxin domain-containing protein [Candidatus Limnocylindria bacterium]
MMRFLAYCLIGLGLVAGAAPSARATVSAGDVAPNFTKNRLGAGATVGAPLSLSDYSGKVVVLALAGYNCGFCVTNAPSFEQNVWQYYQTNYPGQVQVVSGDVYNGTPGQLNGFRTQTGATYPLLLNATLEQGGNFYDLYYPDTDDYVVINKQGIVRYHAADLHAHGQRYKLSELRGCVDSLVTSTTGVGDGTEIAGLALELAPNPFQAVTAVRFTLPTGSLEPVRITVHDLAGRQVATLWNGPAPAGPVRADWDGRSDRGIPTAAGIYLIRADFGRTTLVRRAVRLR